MEQFSNAIQAPFEQIFHKDHPLKGRWQKEIFNNNHPLVLELGCGKGEYTVNLARHDQVRNYIGVDIKGARIWRGAKTALEENIRNAAFLRTRIEFIESFFAPGEVSEIWVTFPDPQLKTRRTKKRLTSPGFLQKYRNIMIPGGIIHLKTDSAELYKYTLRVLSVNNLEILSATSDLYGNNSTDPALFIRTYYESLFLEQGKKITYIRFRLSEQTDFLEPDPDDTEDR
jgi:tRNA (guanine-N7-)-methyltransferase